MPPSRTTTTITRARTPSCLNSEWSLSEVNMFLPPLGGGIFSSTKCLLYPFPVSRPITWRYYLRETRPVKFLIRTRGHIKSKMENTNVNFIIHLYVKSELCLKFRKYEPTGRRKAIKADQKGHRCTQKGPQRASKTRDATREIQKRSPGVGPRHQRRPRGPTSNFWLFESLLWEPSGDPPGGAVASPK